MRILILNALNGKPFLQTLGKRKLIDIDSNVYSREQSTIYNSLHICFCFPELRYIRCLIPEHTEMYFSISAELILLSQLFTQNAVTF